MFDISQGHRSGEEGRLGTEGKSEGGQRRVDCTVQRPRAGHEAMGAYQIPAGLWYPSRVRDSGQSIDSGAALERN